MTPEETHRSLTVGLPALFDCRPGRQGDVQVVTPLLYPDGGFVDVFVVERDGCYVVTDYGDAQSWLWMQSFSGTLTPTQQKLIADACRSLGVELDRGQMVLRCTDTSNLAEMILRLAQAVARVADVWFAIQVDETSDAGETAFTNGVSNQAETALQQPLG